MSAYNPPIENVPIFDSILFRQTNGDTFLTPAEGDLRYLRYPVAQGTENLQAINVNGNSVFASTTTMTLNGQVNLANNLNVGGFGSISMVNSDITMSDNSLIIQNGTRTQSNILGSSQIISGSNIQYLSDNTQQTSAFTGAGALVGSYTYTNMSVDANGKITALSSGIPPSPAPFAPIFANFSNTQSGTTGYSAGTYINWSGTWGVSDYAMFRITAQANYGDTGSGWQNFVSTSGVLILRPYYAPSGVWSSIAGGNPAIYPNNTNNSNLGSTGKAIYYTGAINNGTQTFFFLYGFTNYVQLCFNGATGTTGGWVYTHLLEYICHSPSGGSITLSGGAGTNNSLP
jgi:hypothetical protein